MLPYRSIRLSPLDLLLALALVLSLGWLGYRIHVGLHYNWNWQAIPQYLFRFDETRGIWVPNLLMQGVLTTLRLSVWGIGLALIIGTMVGLLRTSQRLFKRLIGRTYVELIRNLPPLVLILIFYYFISDQIMPLLGLDQLVRNAPPVIQTWLTYLFAPPGLFTAFLSALLSLALFESAYIAEIVRAGIQSVEKGQWEAANALGFNRWQRMRHVIMPQAAQRIIPPLGGQFISTIKDSAIVSVISIQELTFQGMEIMAATYMTFEIWITVTILYLVLTLSCSIIVERLELWVRRKGGH